MVVAELPPVPPPLTKVVSGVGVTVRVDVAVMGVKVGLGKGWWLEAAG
jgi:hypothetical protein